ncbi:MAG: DUF4380 domain-containing protein [Puniceicoccaceae bacterium]|nr:MAG: DUF4380 domain-containing protein [Puniceicoccaceae bacterium]
MPLFSLFRTAAVAALLLTAIPGSALSMFYPDSVLVLQNENALLAVTPSVGGTVVDYRRPDGPSLLDTRWEVLEEPERIPQPSTNAGWVAIDGHTTWLAPQHRWWAQQDLVPDRGNWPPDPWLIYGEYRILEQTPERLVLQSPESPVSGVRLTKTYELRLDGSVHLDATIENIREEPVSWGVWSNTRVPVSAHVFVPIRENTRFWREFSTSSPGRVRAWDYEVVDGFWIPATRELPAGLEGQVGKSYLEAEDGVIAAFIEGDLFLKTAVEPTAPGAAAPRQAAIEIYSHLRANGDALLELEMHGPYRTLTPGELNRFAETWRIVPYPGPEERSAQMAFLRSVLAGSTP